MQAAQQLSSRKVVVSAPRARVVVVRASGGRFASYGGGRSAAAAPARASGLSAADLDKLRIDDLSELASKTGAANTRSVTGKANLISALTAKGVTVNDLTRGMLVDLATKLGAPLAKDVEGLRRNVSAAAGKGSYSAPAASSGSSSWRSTPAPAPAAGGRFSSYSAGATEKASWRRSGSYTASSGASAAGGISAADLDKLRIDDLSELASKTGAANTRSVTGKANLISALTAKGVKVTDLTRGMLVDLATKLGAPLAKDLEGLRRNVSAAVGKGSYSSYSAAPAAASSSSSWRSSPAPAAAPAGGRFSSYAGSNGNGRSSAAGGSDSLFEAELAQFKIDELSNMAAKAGLSLRNATKASLARELASKLKVSDLSKGQLVEILSNIGQPVSGSVADLQARVKANASARQSARALAGARW